MKFRKNAGSSNLGDKQDKEKVRNWYSDRYFSAIIQRNVFLVLSLLCSLSVLMCLLVIKSINEKRSLEPYILELDPRSGVPTVVETSSLKHYTAQESIKEYFLMKYIIARESYDAKNFQENYFTISRLLSSPEIYNSFREKVVQSNPESPINRLAAVAIKKVLPKSITYLKPTEAQIRFSVQTIKETDILDERFYLLNIGFSFVELTLPLEERYINPLGFQVIKYELIEEKVIR